MSKENTRKEKEKESWKKEGKEEVNDIEKRRKREAERIAGKKGKNRRKTLEIKIIK